MANKRAAQLSRTGSGGSSPSDQSSSTHIAPAHCRAHVSRRGSLVDRSLGSKAPSPTESIPKSQIDFQFLNFSHPSDAKASRARRAVRSHVTRQQHQREHAAAAARRAKGAQSSAADEDDDESARRDGPSSTTDGSPETSSPSPSPATSPAQLERINPSELYPEAWHPYIHRIMDHYLANMAVDIPDIDGPVTKGLLRSRFFPFIMTDPAPMHAVMLMAATHYGKVRGSRSHAIDLLQLRGLAIREINVALEDPVRATSDQLIAAVAKMGSYEALYGDRTIFNTHMTGLLRMVSLRGGLPALGLDGLLERILLWIDSNAAYITGSHLYFDKAAFPSTAMHPRPDPRRFAGGSPQEPRQS